jgi:hypothetical protein
VQTDWTHRAAHDIPLDHEARRLSGISFAIPSRCKQIDSARLSRLCYDACTSEMRRRFP